MNRRMYTIMEAAKLSGLPESTLRDNRSDRPDQARETSKQREYSDNDINPGKVFTLTNDLDHIADAYDKMDKPESRPFTPLLTLPVV